MKLYNRTYFIMAKDGEDSTRKEYYTQPLIDRLTFKAFQPLYELSYLKPVHFVLERIFDEIAYRAHQQNCNGDCTVGMTRKDPSDPWKETVMCGYIPLCARLDLKHYDLDHKNNKIVEY